MNLRLFFLVVFSIFMSAAFSQSAVPSLVWDKKYGNGDQSTYDILPLPNGNIIAVGQSGGNNGLVMPDHHGSNSVPDAWVIMVDTAGNILWQKSFGGTGGDYLAMVLPSGDGNLICFGLTSSTNGDLSGNTATQGSWVLKITPQGNIIWSKSYPGIYYSYFNERTRASLGTVLDDGSIALTILPAFGYDLSVLKITANGDVVWRSAANNLTGKFIIETNDHKLLTSTGLMFDEVTGDTSRLAGFPSDIFNVQYPNRDVTAMKKVNGTIWVVVADLSRNLWGYYDEISRSFVLQNWATSNNILGPEYVIDGNGLDVMPGNNIVFAGNARLYDPIWGYDGSTPVFYTGGQIVPYNNYVHAFVGGFASVKTLPGGEGFVIAGHEGTSQYKFWIRKYIMLNTIRGTVFLDANNNNIRDNGERLLDNISVRSLRNGSGVINKPIGGYFNNAVDTGTYITTLALENFPYLQSWPLSTTSTFSSYGNTDTVNFAIHAAVTARNYSVELIPLTPARPMMPVVYSINYANNGTDTLQNKALYFVKDSRLGIVQATPPFDAVSGDTITWNIASLLPFQKGTIHISLVSGNTEPVVIGSRLGNAAHIDSTGDVSKSDNTVFIKQDVTGSFDPNDKAEAHGNSIAKLEVKNGNYLTYTIRFQNTGNDTAFNISIRDTLDSKLDWSSVETVNASHPYQFKVKEGKYLEWKFSNILLADSFVNEPASHGYIVYRIKPKTNLQLNDSIHNSASIYFDFNAPVKTNIQSNVVIKTTALWKGSVSTAWENAANWDINAVPDAETVVIIPGGLTNYPTINSNVTCFSIKADPAATFTVNAGFNIDITGK